MSVKQRNKAQDKAPYKAAKTAVEHAPLALEESVMIASNVERLRKRQNLSILRFSQMAGVSRPTIYKLESGSSDPKLSVLKKVADGLGVSIVDLMTPHKDER